MNREKDLSIETLRGIAIFLMVVAYVIKTDITRDLYTDFSASLLRLFNYSFSPIRMPLFASISGFLLAGSPVLSAAIKKFFFGKVKRLLVPFIIVGTIQYVVFAFLPSVRRHYDLTQLFEIYLWPRDQFWFLPAMFGIYMIVGLLDSQKAFNTYAKWMIAMAAALVLHTAVEIRTHSLALDGIQSLLPFFMLGYGMGRYPKEILPNKHVMAFLSMFAAAFLFQFWVYYKNYPFGFHGYQIIGILVGIPALALIYHFRRPVPWLARLGSHSFAIYLYYRLCAAPIQEILHRYPVPNPFLVLILVVPGALLLPIAIERLFEKNFWSSRLFLGQNPVRTPQEQIHPRLHLVETL